MTPASDHDALERTVVDFQTRLEQTSGQWRRLASTVLIFPSSHHTTPHSRTNPCGTNVTNGRSVVEYSARENTSAQRIKRARGVAEVFLSNFFRLLYCLDGSYLVLKHTVTSTTKSLYWTSGPPRFSVLSKSRAPVAARIGQGIAVQSS